MFQSVWRKRDGARIYIDRIACGYYLLNIRFVYKVLYHNIEKKSRQKSGEFFITNKEAEFDKNLNI